MKKGQLLFVIEEDTYKATLDAAVGRRDEAEAALAKAKQSRATRIAQAQLNLDKAVLTLARVEEVRTRTLFARNSAPASDYDKAKADLDKAAAQVEADEAKLEQAKADYDVNIRSAQATLEAAEAQVRQARIDLGYCRMYSPLDGRIGEAKVKVGNLVGPSSTGGETTELATIQQLDPMGVDLEVPSRALARATRLIKAGLTATISKAGLEGEPDLTYPSVAYFIDNTINPTTSTFLIKARVNNPEGLLLPGEYVKADVVVEQLRDVLVVPESAVVETQAGPTVLTVNSHGKVDIVAVKVGLIDNGLSTITSGLDAGAVVIVGRRPSIRPGMTVKVVRQPADADAPDDRARSRLAPEILQPRGAAIVVNFFISRPIFATVLALLMLIVGGIAALTLPVALYPPIAPPQVQITTTYTGANAETVAKTVTTPIEQQINGTKGQIYFSSDSTSTGQSIIVATFDVGYSQDIAAVDIQNYVQTAQAVLPNEVKQFGVTIKKTSTDMVCVVNLISPDGRYDATFLDNYGQINVVDVLKRIKGVSDANPFGRKYAMRIWLDPDRMANQKITPAEVVGAIQDENRQAAAGKVGAAPVPAGQVHEYPIEIKGRLERPSEFEDIVVRRGDEGSIVRIKDVARVELESETYDTAGWLNGKPAGTIPIYQLAGANALDIVSEVRSTMERLKKDFPPGLDYRIGYDTTLYVRENMAEVRQTLFEAFVLVLIVVFVFLQGYRATIIPMLAIPVSLVATFAMMAVFGFSINTLTLCGLILAIGLVVNDAIIVVENVEKYLARGVGPTEAARGAMAEITAPIVTIALVLAAVFVPVAFIPGLTGRLYNQFAMTIVFSFLFSAFNSLTFTPAMARLFLRPHHGETRFFLFRWFNRGMRWLENSYDSFLEAAARQWWAVVIPSIGLLVLTGWMAYERPKAFVPIEDQGYLVVSIQTPEGTTREPTSRVAQQAGAIAQKLPGVRDVLILDGYDVVGSLNQANTATMFVILEDWAERGRPELRADALSRRLQGEMFEQIRDARVTVLQPPPIRGLSQTGGLELMIEDREGRGVEALAEAVDAYLDAAHGRPELAGVFTTFTTRVPQLRFELDRTKARRLDVAIPDVFSVLQTNLGAYYVNDFNLYGKTWKVMVQAEGVDRRRPDDIARLWVVNGKGQKVPLGALGVVKRTLAPIDVPHYNMYNAARITGMPAPGYSSGQAVAAMEELAARALPQGFGSEWTGVTYQQKKTGDIATMIFGLSVVCVFLFMSALYESWIRPAVIVLTVPLAIFGAMLGLWLYDMPLDVFGQIGLVMLIGLETKNAILIVEFAVELMEKHGMSIVESAKEASRQRLRPILMTSCAFVFGVLPMARATGAGAYSRNSLGIVIAFGIAVSTVIGRLVIPVYYVLGERIRAGRGAAPTPSRSPIPRRRSRGSPSPSWSRTEGSRDDGRSVLVCTMRAEIHPPARDGRTPVPLPRLRPGPAGARAPGRARRGERLRAGAGADAARTAAPPPAGRGPGEFAGEGAEAAAGGDRVPPRRLRGGESRPGTERPARRPQPRRPADDVPAAADQPAVLRVESGRALGLPALEYRGDGGVQVLGDRPGDRDRRVRRAATAGLGPGRPPDRMRRGGDRLLARSAAVPGFRPGACARVGLNRAALASRPRGTRVPDGRGRLPRRDLPAGEPGARRCSHSRAASRGP